MALNFIVPELFFPIKLDTIRIKVLLRSLQTKQDIVFHVLMLQLMYVMESMEQTLCLDRFAIGFKINYNFNTLKYH